MKRKDIKFKELLKNDLDAAEIFNEAIELADIRHRHYYYREEFLNQTLSEKNMDWALPGRSIQILEEGFEELDKNDEINNVTVSDNN